MHQYCTFVLGEHLFGVSVASVQEVLRAQPVTRVPLAPPAVAGLINLRGQIVTTIELRTQLGLAPRDPEDPGVNVVVTSADGSAVSLVVDDVGDVLEPPPRSFEPPPATVPAAVRPLIEGVCKLDHHLMLLLDTERAVTLGGTP